MLGSRATHDDLALAAGLQLERLVAIRSPRVCSACIGIDVATGAVLKQVGEVRSGCGGSWAETHGCIYEVEAEICRRPLGVASADRGVTGGLLGLVANECEQAPTVVHPALQECALFVAEDGHFGALAIHDDDEHVHVAVELEDGVDGGDGLSLGSNPLGKWLYVA